MNIYAKKGIYVSNKISPGTEKQKYIYYMYYIIQFTIKREQYNKRTMSL